MGSLALLMNGKSMMTMLAYNTALISNPKITGFDMKNCIECEKSFYARHSAEACCLKCKILSNIQKTDQGCWLYKKSCSGAYGKVRWQSKWYSAHRISYEQFVGKIPEGKWICHKCDTPKCVNPEHLFVGSASDNRKDAVKKRRVALGEKNHFAKFTDKQIEEMRLLNIEGFTYERLSRIFNCSYTFVYNIINNLNRIKNGV